MIAPATRSVVCVVSILVALSLAACGGNPAGPTPPQPPARTVNALQITGVPSVSEGKASQFAAQAMWSDGTLEDVSVRASWRSLNAEVATVSSRGLVTGVRIGTTEITAEFQGQSGRMTLQIVPPLMLVAFEMQSITALETCDDVTQGLDRGEFAYRVRLVDADGGRILMEAAPSDYPGNPNNLRHVILGRNQPLTLTARHAYELRAEAGQFVRLEFNGTEWDDEIVIIPPSIRKIHDSRLSDRGVTRTHQYSNGTFTSIGSNSITVGNASCGLRLDYQVAVTRE